MFDFGRRERKARQLKRLAELELLVARLRSAGTNCALALHGICADNLKNDVQYARAKREVDDYLSRVSIQVQLIDAEISGLRAEIDHD